MRLTKLANHNKDRHRPDNASGKPPPHPIRAATIKPRPNSVSKSDRACADRKMNPRERQHRPLDHRPIVRPDAGLTSKASCRHSSARSRPSPSLPDPQSRPIETMGMRRPVAPLRNGRLHAQAAQLPSPRLRTRTPSRQSRRLSLEQWAPLDLCHPRMSLLYSRPFRQRRTVRRDQVEREDSEDDRSGQPS